MIEELTGRRRYREERIYHPLSVLAGYKNVLVLQVEVSVWANGREDKPGRWVCQWRDATSSDVNKRDIV